MKISSRLSDFVLMTLSGAMVLAIGYFGLGIDRPDRQQDVRIVEVVVDLPDLTNFTHDGNSIESLPEHYELSKYDVEAVKATATVITENLNGHRLLNYIIRNSELNTSAEIRIRGLNGIENVFLERSGQYVSFIGGVDETIELLPKETIVVHTSSRWTISDPVIAVSSGDRFFDIQRSGDVFRPFTSDVHGFWGRFIISNFQMISVLASALTVILLIFSGLAFANFAYRFFIPQNTEEAQSPEVSEIPK